jgi:hypothetical protein
METARAMKGYRAPAQHGGGGGHPAQRAQAGVQALGAPREPTNWMEMNPGQLQRFATNQVQQNTQAELTPYRARNAELGNIEKTTAQRYGAYGEAADKLMQGVQGEASASAKTAQNEAAEASLRASKGVETAGQNAVTANAGYMDPQLRAALSAQTQNSAQIGQAREANAANLGAGENTFMANLRAAAAQRVTEGQKGIASTYAAQRGKVGTEEQRLLARQPGAITKLDQELLQKQFTNRATEAGLGFKGQELQNKTALAGSTLNVNQARITKSNQEAGEKAKGQAGKEALTRADTEQKQADAAYKKLTAADKAAYDKWKMGGGSGGVPGKTASPTAGRKYAAAINNAYSSVKAELERGEKRGYKGQQLYNLAVKQLGEGKYTGKGGKEPGNPMAVNLIHAALSLIYNKGKLVGKPRTEALENGLNPTSPWLQ